MKITHKIRVEPQELSYKALPNGAWFFPGGSMSLHYKIDDRVFIRYDECTVVVCATAELYHEMVITRIIGHNETVTLTFHGDTT